MSQAIPDKYRDLFTKRAFASLATLMPDGRPQVTPVWCDIEGDLVIVKKTRTCAAILVLLSPSSIPTILIVIWKSVGAWWKSQNMEPMITSTKWPKNIWVPISILTAQPASSA